MTKIQTNNTTTRPVLTRSHLNFAYEKIKKISLNALEKSANLIAKVGSYGANTLHRTENYFERNPHLLPKFQIVFNRVHSTFAEIFTTVSLSTLYAIPQTLFNPKASSDHHTPILLIHGYGQNSSCWAYHRNRLNKAGFGNVFTVDLGNPLHSIEEYADVVAKKIRDIKHITGQSEISLIGHSMGGVVAAHSALQLVKQGEISIKNLVTLGSPLQGTPLGKVGIGKCAKQMKANSFFITNLSQSLKESDIPCFHMASQFDLLVFPERSALNGTNGENTRSFPNLGHNSFLLSDQVIDEIINLL